MLIEFRVENFLSIQDEQILSMMASKDNTFLILIPMAIKN